MPLRPYSEFQRIISPFLTQLAPQELSALTREIYALATKKVHFENIKAFSLEHTRVCRSERVRLERKRAHIRNAMKELAAAQKIQPSGPLTVMYGAEKITLGFDFTDAMSQLVKEQKELLESEQLLALSIPPELRSPAEKELSMPFKKYMSVLPGMKVASIDYWFISKLEKRLSKISPQKSSVIDEKRNSIISKIFDAAFGETYNTARVKTARRRIAGRPRVTSPSLPGQKD